MFNIKKKKLDQVACYQATFSSEDGKKVLYDLMKVHNVMGSTFSPNSNEMILKEGERNVVLRIMHLLKIDPQKLIEEIEKGISHDNQYID
jgi:hypothetical protein